MSPELTFDDSAVEHVLDAFDKEIEQGFVVEQESGERVLRPDGEPVTRDDFGGIAKGSELFVENNYASILEYTKRNKE